MKVTRFVTRVTENGVKITQNHTKITRKANECSCFFQPSDAIFFQQSAEIIINFSLVFFLLCRQGLDVMFVHSDWV